MSVLIRPVLPTDAEALARIYGHHVLHGLGTFEEIPPTPEEMEARLSAVLERGLPYLAAEVDGRLAGFAYAAPFRLRAAYRHTVEDSVYVASNRIGQGVGKALLSALIARCEALDLRQMLALIGDSGNAASIGVHLACGFQPAGVLTGVGFKAGRWVDVVMMRRPLNGGVDAAPAGDGLSLSGG